MNKKYEEGDLAQLAADSFFEGYKLGITTGIKDLESQLKIDWHKYPEEVPEDTSDKWITLKNCNYTKKDYYWDGKWKNYDGLVVRWADITYPEPYKE